MKSTKTTTINNIIKQFNGLKKVEAYELISKIETVLYFAPNPINFYDDHEITSYTATKNINIDPFQFTILPNGNFGEFLGQNDFIQVYKEHRRIVPNWKIFNTYYFTSKHYPLEFIKLTKNNILTSTKGTNEEERFKGFLKESKVDKKHLITGRLLILDV